MLGDIDTLALTWREQDILRETREDMPMPSASLRQAATHQGSIARILDTMKTPYVVTSETTMFVKTGLPIFLTAWTVHNTAPTSILRVNMSDNPGGVVAFRLTTW